MSPDSKLARLKQAAEAKKASKSILTEKETKETTTTVEPPPKTKDQISPKKQEKIETKEPSILKSISPELTKKIIDTVLDDPRLSDYNQVARAIFSVRKRSDEIESKTKTVKEIVDEEIKRILTKK